MLREFHGKDVAYPVLLPTSVGRLDADIFASFCSMLTACRQSEWNPDALAWKSLHTPVQCCFHRHWLSPAHILCPAHLSLSLMAESLTRDVRVSKWLPRLLLPQTSSCSMPEICSINVHTSKITSGPCWWRPCSVLKAFAKMRLC